MLNKQPLVSILIPYYNDENFLADSIESVLTQTYTRFELILLNHASEDNSRNIAHSYKDTRIKHIDMEKNMGAGGALLILEFLKYAKGDYIKLFGADDILKPNYLEKMVEFASNNYDVDMFFADTEFIDGNGKFISGKKHSTTRNKFQFNNTPTYWIGLYLQGVSSLPYTTCMIKASTFRESAYFNKTAIILQDVTLWLSMLVNGSRIAILDESLAYYRIHDGQISSWKHINLISQRSWYEYHIVSDLFYKIKDYKAFIEVFKNSKYINLLSYDDEDFYKEFIVAHYFLSGNAEFAKVNGYLHMHNLLQDDYKREKLEQRFNFGVKEFRELYSYIPPQKRLNWFTRQKNKQGRNISLLGLFYLELRELMHIILLKKIKEKIRNKKKQLSA